MTDAEQSTEGEARQVTDYLGSLSPEELVERVALFDQYPDFLETSGDNDDDLLSQLAVCDSEKALAVLRLSIRSEDSSVRSYAINALIVPALQYDFKRGAQLLDEIFGYPDQEVGEVARQAIYDHLDEIPFHYRLEIAKLAQDHGLRARPAPQTPPYSDSHSG